MIKEIKTKEDGSIMLEIDNSELLHSRADMDTEDVFKSDRSGLGGMKGKEEDKLKADKKKTKWSEPSHKATDVKHMCPVCGTRYWGRPNKAYCGIPCKEVAKKRRQRKRKRDLRDFKPYRGKAGEVYFMSENEGNNTITFVPAFNADSRVRAKKYIEDTHPADKADDYYEQVKEVILK